LKTTRGISIALHWNGHTWSQIPSPSPGTVALLFAVSAHSSTDAWAVGQYCACSAKKPISHGFTLHWNGTSWKRVALPITNSWSVTGVDDISPTNAWAVGGRYLSGNRLGPVLLHWNGRRWRKVQGPNVFASALALNSSASGWAAGGSAFFMRWNGHSWQQVTTRAPFTADFFGVAADRRADAWAVGDFCTANCTGNSPTTHTIALHWNGKKWSRT
jgi:hypothetical protein